MNITAVYVTHDQVEALAMSNVIAVMNGGKIEQRGHPREIYNNPSSRFVADFIGTSNFIDGQVEGKAGAESLEVSTAHGPVIVPTTMALNAGDAVTVSIRPEHVGLEEGVEETRPFGLAG